MIYKQRRNGSSFSWQSFSNFDQCFATIAQFSNLIKMHPFLAEINITRSTDKKNKVAYYCHQPTVWGTKWDLICLIWLLNNSRKWYKVTSLQVLRKWLLVRQFMLYICTSRTAKHRQKRYITYLATTVKNKMSPDTCDLKK